MVINEERVLGKLITRPLASETYKFLNDLAKEHNVVINDTLRVTSTSKFAEYVVELSGNKIGVFDSLAINQHSGLRGLIHEDLINYVNERITFEVAILCHFEKEGIKHDNVLGFIDFIDVGDTKTFSHKNVETFDGDTPTNIDDKYVW